MRTQDPAAHAVSKDTRFAQAVDTVRREAVRSRRSKLMGTLLATVIFVSVIVIVELLLTVFNVAEWTVPRPTRVAQAWWENLGTVILPNAGITLAEVVVGFTCGALIGVVLGGVIGEYQILDKVLSPFILILVTTPVVALVPLLQMWFGFGPETKIVAAAIASFPPVMMNTVAGLAKTPALQLDLMSYLGASRWNVFLRVKLFNALPAIFTGLTIASIFALITTVGAEFVGGSTGLGNRLIYYASTVQTPLMFAIIATLAVIGIIMYVFISMLSRRVVSWKS